MKKRAESKTAVTPPALAALRRAGKRALELGRATGTPVYVIEGNRIVDATKRKRPSR